MKTHFERSDTITMMDAINGHKGSARSMMACVDRLVELKEIREVKLSNTPNLFRMFTKR
jgi:hypothetical protein